MWTSGTGPRTEGSFILVLGCGGLISAADNWIVAPILPSIADSLGISVAQAALILTAYMIPYGLMQPVHGHISEGYGRLRLLRGLMLGLVCGTRGCARSPSFL
ncbi:MAG: MFS transporter, partial [Rhodospirillaceae bacterium]|nr:MFS transporter [Rhodospirillaceae bacterium]